MSYLSGQVQMMLTIALELGAWVEVRQNGGQTNSEDE